MRPLIDADFTALSVMWKKNYTHRDISPGNIIMYKGRAKLSDLEFAAGYGTIPREDIRIVRAPTSSTLLQQLNDVIGNI